MTAKSLPLYEEILLLELDDDKGTTAMECWCNTEMGGAILAELVLRGAITIDDDKKKHVHRVPGKGKLGDPILDEAVAKIKESKKPKSASTWVEKFANIKDLKNRAARQLVKKGILKEDTGKILFLFNRTIFPESNPGPEQELRRRLEEAVFSNSREVDPGTLVIVSLTHATGLLKKIFGKKRLKSREKRLAQIAEGQLAGKATKEAVEAIQAMIIATTVLTTTIAVTTTATN